MKTTTPGKMLAVEKNRDKNEKRRRAQHKLREIKFLEFFTILTKSQKEYTKIVFFPHPLNPFI